MQITVDIPAPFTNLTAGVRQLQLDADDVAHLLDELDSRYSGFKSRVFAANGELRRFVHVYVNHENIYTLDALATRLQPGDKVSFFPGVANPG